jgi:hypothetical protein
MSAEQAALSAAVAAQAPQATGTVRRVRAVGAVEVEEPVVALIPSRLTTAEMAVTEPTEAGVVAGVRTMIISAAAATAATLVSVAVAAPPVPCFP